MSRNANLGRLALLCATAPALLAGAPLLASHTPAPGSVTVAGSFQSELGCPGDWQPECAVTHLAFDAADQAWQGTFALPAGAWEYKAALDGGWTENYGQNASPGGANITLNLAAGESVRFYYSHETHWIASSANAVIATVPGSFQSELGCPGDWQPDCLRSWLQDPDGDGTYAFTTNVLPAGSYEAKVAIDESWDENYGQGGVPGGANIPFSVPAGGTVTFTYDPVSHVLAITTGGVPPQPASVTIPGSLQSELGCPGDWQPDCAATHLAFDAADVVWQGTFSVPAGSWEYKAALNDSWDENYGLNAMRNGANIPLDLPAGRDVKFYYDHATHWVTSTVNSVIATVPGSFQSELGCPGDWQPDCLRSWLQDADGDGIYTFSTSALPVGSYEAKVAIGESWNENYGAGGVPNGPNIAFTVPAPATEVFFSYDPVTHVLDIGNTGAPRGDLRRAQAYWLSRDTIAWNVAAPADAAVALHYSPDADLQITGGGVQNGVAIPLVADPAGLPAELRQLFPHLAGHRAFRLPADRLGEVAAALRGQFAVSATDGQGRGLDATALQIPGVLDDLYAYDGPLGAEFRGGAPTLRVWAPTARSVRLRLFADSSPASSSSIVPMTRDDASGVWSAAGDAGWNRRFYLYEVDVFVRATGSFETNLVTDPYSVSLSTNSRRSQLVDVGDADLKPAGWDALRKPRLDAPEDISIYELHVRDFSASDPSVPEPLRGTFKAFTLESSNGMRHLAGLARDGLTHVHLLPSFDIASVDEDRATWQSPAGDLASYPPDSTEQQAAVAAVANADGYNWGYDPWHFDVPEGSYATEPDGPARVLEFREMVATLARQGLRVVMDVVYNHTTAAGQDAKSVLDRIVPGYYHRLDADGAVETSTCCQNTATEHRMMEKLMVDSVVLWARHYKVDGFRFDLMGHHMKRNMLAVRQALDALTPARDGVDGRQVYLYGEGWNFGEVANGARGVNATQLEMAGTGIGTFSDRMRDGVRGGGPFSGLQEQGFATGLYFDPNGTAQGSEQDQRARLLLFQDWIKVGLAGNLARYRFVDRFGHLVAGSDVDYNGQPAGYTADPQEVISYVEAHDNETLFDAVQLKAPAGASLPARARMHALGLSLVGLGQGVPFIHAGSEMLRSKSIDRNSYNSGDWFNRLDFTYSSNNWGVGLPPAAENQANWPIMGPLLANPTLRPDRDLVVDSVAHLREILQMRRSSRLFRLRTAAEVTKHLALLNPGPEPLAGVVGLVLSDASGALDRRFRRIAVVWNANDAEASLREGTLAGEPLKLHPVQASSVDPVVRTASFDPASAVFTVPGRTAAVFVGWRPAGARLVLLSADVAALVQGGALAAGLGRSLQAKLEAARLQAARGHGRTAANQLDAFVNEVEALVRAGRLPAEDGQALVAEAREIAALLHAGS